MPFQSLIHELARLLSPRLGGELQPVRVAEGGGYKQTWFVFLGNQPMVLRLSKNPGAITKELVIAQILKEQGMPVPEVFHHGLDLVVVEGSQPLPIAWILEQQLSGVHFEPWLLQPAESASAASEMGHCLRTLHGITTKGFGHVSEASLQADSLTMEVWLQKKGEHISRWAAQVAADRYNQTLLNLVQKALRVLSSYTDPPALCHGDFAHDNLLVQDGHFTGVVDFEAAGGYDPAFEIAHWHFWSKSDACLNALLSAYAPINEAAFRKRIAAHILMMGASGIAFFEHAKDPQGVQHCKQWIKQVAAQV
ncbi:MAG TPA: aminoglycoside phosphotransferase family protein [Planctomycetota bacterium]|nr:aminoglycoside phosphotransferase family protein [Planctomycetota bacterium]